jgi:outer membrane lipoprotein SlyB
MERRVIWLCALAGSILGGLLPQAWGASSFGVAAFVGGVVGAVAGVWAGVRIGEFVDS